MEDIVFWLSILGSIASIGGAIWSFCEARKSAKSASEAKRIRDELIDKRKLVEISKLHGDTSRILQRVSKFGPSCNASTIRGVNSADIAKEVEEYCRNINEYSIHFQSESGNSATQLCQDLLEDIAKLSEAKTFDMKKEAGSRMYNKISAFLPVVKELTDTKMDIENI